MRAESAGMLAATIFLSTVQKFTNGSLGSIQANYFADNQALITRMNQHQQFVEPFVNTHLIPEYDLTEEIYMLQQRHNIKANFDHVKGHLDDKKELAALAQEERMNVEADAAATLYYEKGPPSSPKCSLTESSPIQLHIRGHTITSNYDREINRAYLEPKYMAKLQDKF